jgi:hypothetical protein
MKVVLSILLLRRRLPVIGQQMEEVIASSPNQAVIETESTQVYVFSCFHYLVQIVIWCL